MARINTIQQQLTLAKQGRELRVSIDDTEGIWFWHGYATALEWVLREKPEAQ